MIGGRARRAPGVLTLSLRSFVKVGDWRMRSPGLSGSSSPPNVAKQALILSARLLPSRGGVVFRFELLLVIEWIRHYAARLAWMRFRSAAVSSRCAIFKS